VLLTAVLALAACGDRNARARAKAAKVHVENAKAAMAAGNSLRAFAAAQEATAVDPTDPALHALLNLTRFRAIAEDPREIGASNSESLDYLAESLVASDAKNAHVYNTVRGWATLARGRAADAEKLFRKAAEADAHWAPARVGIAETLQALGKAEEANAAAEEAVKADPKSVAAMDEVGRRALARGDYAKAVEFLGKSAQARETAATRLALAEAHLRKGNGNEAHESLQRANALDSRNAEVHLRLGDLYLEAKRYPDSAKEYDLAVRLGAGALGTFGKALVASRTGDHKTAATLFETAAGAAPEMTVAIYQAGISHEYAGDAETAVERYDAYVQRAQADPGERQRVADAQARAEKLRAAPPAEHKEKEATPAVAEPKKKK